MQRADTAYPISDGQTEGLTKRELVSINLTCAMISAGDHHVTSTDEVIDLALAMADELCDRHEIREDDLREKLLSERQRREERGE